MTRYIKQLDNVVKLDSTNWHHWANDFGAVMKAYPKINNILYGNLLQRPLTAEEKQLDARLVPTIRGCCDRTGSNNVSHVIDAKSFPSGRQLYDKLQEELTKNLKQTTSSILMDLTQIRMVNDDVVHVVAQVQDLATRANLVGRPLSSDQKIQAVQSASNYSSSFRDVWSTLETIGSANDWDQVVVALKAKQRRVETQPYTRGQRAVALQATSQDTRVNHQRPAVNAEDAYWFGRRDPRFPDQPAKCYNCDKPGHIAKECPDPQRQQAPRPQRQAAPRQQRPQRATAQVAEDTNVELEGTFLQLDTSEDAHVAIVESDDDDDSVSFIEYAAAATNSPAKLSWTLDSGATSHMTNDASVFESMTNAHGTVRTAGSQVLPVKGRGQVKIHTPVGVLVLEKVLYVPGLSDNLISEVKLWRAGVKIVWDHPYILLVLPNGQSIEFSISPSASVLKITSTHRRRRLDTALATTTDEAAAMASSSSVKSPNLLVHKALSHPGPEQQRKMVKALLHVDATGADAGQADCAPCALGKATKARLPRVSQAQPATDPLELLHIDILTVYTGNSAYRFALTIVDDATDLIHVVPLVNKGQAALAFQDFVTLAEKQTGKFLKAMRSDNDAVFLSNNMLDWKAEKGIVWHLTTADDSRTNGKAERANRTLRERMQANLFSRSLPYSLWPEAIEYAATCLNLGPHGTRIPYEAFWNRSAAPLARFLQPFGCLAWVFVPERKRYGGKGGPRSLPSIFIGVSNERKGWKFYSANANPSTFWSNSARFHPDLSWSDRHQVADWRQLIDHQGLFAERGDAITNLSYSPLDIIVERDEQVHPHYVPTVDYDDCMYSEYCHVALVDGELVSLPPEEGEDLQDFEWQPFSSDAALAASSSSSTIDTSPSVSAALNGPNAALWREAIRKELEGLNDMGTFEVVDLPFFDPDDDSEIIILDSRMVLKIKLAPDGTPLKYKARLVARGFAQVKDLHHGATFAPVAPYTAIRTILAVAVSYKWHVHATDFTQAYLNGNLEEKIFMRPPPGTKLPVGKVYKVLKGLYGLKQSGRVWHQHLDTLLRSLGFMPLDSAPCVYLRGQGETTVIIAVYVDDLVLASPSEPELELVKKGLLKSFKMEDKGAISSFCGIDIKYQQGGADLTLSQHGYVNSIIDEFGDDAGDKRQRTPMVNTPSHTTIDPQVQPEYRAIVGKLLWLANHTRPDISFAASTLSRHLASSSQEHLDAAYGVVRYLKQSRDWCLTYEPDLSKPMVAYSDANWASDANSDRKSTSGFCVFVNGCLVSWRSQLQRCVSLSAVEAELVAASEAARELMFLRNLLREAGLLSDDVPTLLTDSLGCTQVAQDPAHHWRLKHIDTRFYYLRDLVKSKELTVAHLPGVDNPADILTKAVGHHILDRHCKTLKLAGK